MRTHNYHKTPTTRFHVLSQAVKRWYVIGVLIAVGLFGTVQAWRQSMTTDEGIHVASSYLALTRGEHRFDPEHPFLFKYLTALPILVLQPNLPKDDATLWDDAKPTYYDSWREAREWSDQWIYQSGNNAQLMIFLARIPGVLALVALVWLVWFTTRHWFGNSVARWALFFTALNPTLLAHGPLTNTDVPVALASLFVIWRLWRYFEEQTWKNVVWIGAALGIALTTKYSALILLPIAFIWLIYTAAQKRQSVVVTIVHGGSALLLMWFVIWSVYFWRSPIFLDGTSNIAVSTASDLLKQWGLNLDTITHQMKWILPTAFTKGALLTIGSSVFGRSVYFLGTTYSSGVWHYFPTLFILKSQLIVVLLTLTGIGLFARRIFQPWTWKPASVLILITVALLTYASVTSKLNLGIRHISTLMPFSAIFLATTTVYMKQILLRKGFIIAITAGMIFPVVSQSSDLIGFRNSIVYPREQSYQYFNDSNLDWGQQSKRITEVVTREFDGKKLFINYRWNPYAIAYYGTENNTFDPQNPPKGELVAVTATQLSSGEYHYFAGLEPNYILDNNTFFYLLPQF